MSYSVNWTTKVITVPLTDLTLISGSNYSLSTTDFWLEMRRLEASPGDGLWAEQSVEYVNTQVLSGITYSAIVKLINGYTWKTDTTDKNISLIGFNSNLLDVFIPGNGISVLANNSAGLQLVDPGPTFGTVDPDLIWQHALVNGYTAEEELVDIRVPLALAKNSSDLAKTAADGAETEATAANVAAQAAQVAAEAAEVDATAAKVAAEAAEAAVLAMDPMPDATQLNEIWEAHFRRREWNKVANTITIYDSDNTTPLFVFDTNADLSDIVPQ